jgi:glucose-1-phosphate thymidylyltransferase
MFLTPYTKVWVVLGALIVLVLSMLATPFLVTSGNGFLSREVIQAFFLAFEFFGAIFLLNEFNRLRIIIKEKEMSDRRLANIESGIKKLTTFKKSEQGMKGIILAGGTATRLFPLTATTSKQLLPIYDKQMIFYPLNTLIKAGIKDILVIVAPDQSGQYLNLLGSIFKKFGINLYFEVQKVPKGLADAFILGENFIGNDNVAMILGDNILEDNISEDIRQFKKGGMIFVKEVTDNPSRYGIVEFDENGKAISIEEKPKYPKSNFCVTGVYTYDSRVADIAKNLKPSARGEIEITDLNNRYLQMGELTVKKIEGEWLDAGTFDTLLEAGKIVKEKEIYRNFDPLVEEAIAEFNAELKDRTKRILDPHGLYLRQDESQK